LTLKVSCASADRLRDERHGTTSKCAVKMFTHPNSSPLSLVSGVERLYEGDPAPTECFDELVSILTEDGINGGDLIPWKHKNPHRRDDYLVLLCDPRPESPELRATVKNLLAEVPAEILKRVVIVNADTPAKNRRWLKKDGLENSKIKVYSDEKMGFMQAYTVSFDMFV
jgi:hypothetical protein